MVYPIYPTAYHFNAVQHRTPRHGNGPTDPNQDNDAFQRQLAEQPKPDAQHTQGQVTPQQGSITHSDTAAHSTQKSLQGQPIGIDDIVNDVAGTMDALGADEATRTDVAIYLAAIQHQAGQRKPSKAFIQESLKVIGHRLDRFIGDALKQPSTVVNEWVNALLLQPIDYKTRQGAALIPSEQAVTPSAPSNTRTPKHNAENSNAPEPTEQATPQPSASAVGTTLQLAQQNIRLGDTETALTRLNQLLSEPNLTAKQTGRIHLALAEAHLQAQHTEAAQQALQTALAYPIGGKASVKAHAQLATVLEQTGHTQAAIEQYQQGIALAQKAAQHNTAAAPQAAQLLAQLENDLGSLLYLNQQPEKAKNHFNNARQWAIKADKPLLPDIYSNLALAWQALDNPTQRNQAYLKGMNAAKRLGDQSGYLNLLAQYQQHVAA